jgi:twitching motility protein PilI
MSRRFSLRQFQTELSKRLQEAATLQAETSRLGFLSAGQNWLVPLSDIDEVMPVPAIRPVPGTRRWFRGLANIRGNLYAVSDLSDYLTGKPTPDSHDNRLILAHRKHGVNAALLVQKALGLKQSSQMIECGEPGIQPWAATHILDSGKDTWHEINLARFLAEAEFLTVEAN